MNGEWYFNKITLMAFVAGMALTILVMASNAFASNVKANWTDNIIKTEEVFMQVVDQDTVKDEEYLQLKSPEDGDKEEFLDMEPASGPEMMEDDKEVDLMEAPDDVEFFTDDKSLPTK